MAKGIRKTTEENEVVEQVKEPTKEQPFYEEWRVQITIKKEGDKNVPTYEKLKKMRPRVLISDEQADVLNEGVLYGGNNYALMYFKPE